jgi:hypothetical protein
VLADEAPLGLVIVDYLQLIDAPAGIQERRLQVEAVSKRLKGITLDFGVPVLCLSSLSRPRTGRRRRSRRSESPAISSTTPTPSSCCTVPRSSTRARSASSRSRAMVALGWWSCTSAASSCASKSAMRRRPADAMSLDRAVVVMRGIAAAGCPACHAHGDDVLVGRAAPPTKKRLAMSQAEGI